MIRAMRKRNITQADIEASKRLREIWNAKKESLSLTQSKAAEILGYASQGVAGQYLNGHVALGTEATIKWAKLLQVKVDDIRPEIGSFAQVNGVNDDLSLYRSAITLVDAKLEAAERLMTSKKRIKLYDNIYSIMKNAKASGSSSVSDAVEMLDNLLS